MRVLEIGPGPRPAIFNDLQLTENDFYVGVDSGFLANDAWHNKFPAAYALGVMRQAQLRLDGASAAQFLVASGTMLPFKDASFNRVQIGNVLGASINELNRTAILRESRRVLQKAGSLVIAETISPLPIEALTQLAAIHDLVIESVYKPGQTDYESQRRSFGIAASPLIISPQILAEYPVLNTDYITVLRTNS